MRHLVAACLAGLALAASAASAGAQPLTIPGLFNTGVDAGGAKLGVGQTDPHYVIVGLAGTPQAVVTNNGAYTQSPSAGYVWQDAIGSGVGTLTFRTTFDLTGFDPSTVVLEGAWSVDNFGTDILINGVSTGIARIGNGGFNFTSFAPFTISSGFVAGINTLDFVVENVGGPGALAVNALTGRASAVPSSTVPEPATILLVASGLLATAGVARRRRTP